MVCKLRYFSLLVVRKMENYAVDISSQSTWTCLAKDQSPIGIPVEMTTHLMRADVDEGIILVYGYPQDSLRS
jgi:hypothetical protein